MHGGLPTDGRDESRNAVFKADTPEAFAQFGPEFVREHNLTAGKAYQNRHDIFPLARGLHFFSPCLKLSLQKRYLRPQTARRCSEGGQPVPRLWSAVGERRGMSTNPPSVAEIILQRVTTRTGRRVRELSVEVGPGRVVLRGRTSSFHVKQLAQHGVREILPDARLENAIVVE